jgi:hypothetical protein
MVSAFLGMVPSWVPELVVLLGLGAIAEYNVNASICMYKSVYTYSFFLSNLGYAKEYRGIPLAPPMQDTLMNSQFHFAIACSSLQLQSGAELLIHARCCFF